MSFMLAAYAITIVGLGWYGVALHRERMRQIEAFGRPTAKTPGGP